MILARAKSGAEVTAVQTLRELDAARRSDFREKAAICKMKEKNAALSRDAATLTLEFLSSMHHLPP